MRGWDLGAVKSAFFDFDSFGPSDLDTRQLQALAPGIALYPATTPRELAARLQSVEIAIVNKVRIDSAAIGASPQLRLICVAATGTDNVDVAAARAAGIGVCNIRNYGVPSVVQHVYALILALTQRLNEYRELVAGGAWERSAQFCLLDYPVRELRGKTLGIVGMGALGRGVAQVGQAFGMNVIARQREAAIPAADGIARVPLTALLAQSDVVSLHCPLTAETRHLINRDSLSLMRPTALLINTARGALVEPQALLDALQNGRLAGAGIDVLAEEPPPAGHPLLAAKLPHLLVTPHMAWSARESRQRALDEITANVAAYLAGERRNRID